MDNYFINRNVRWGCFVKLLPLYLGDQQVDGEGVNYQPQLSCEPNIRRPCCRITHLSSINVQRHAEAVVSGHQVSPGIGSVALVAIDCGGFYSPVCAECEVEPCVFGAGRFHGADAHRPALLTQRMGTVVKYTYGEEETRKYEKRNQLFLNSTGEKQNMQNIQGQRTRNLELVTAFSYSLRLLSW